MIRALQLRTTIQKARDASFSYPQLPFSNHHQDCEWLQGPLQQPASEAYQLPLLYFLTGFDKLGSRPYMIVFNIPLLIKTMQIFFIGTRNPIELDELIPMSPLSGSNGLRLSELREPDSRCFVTLRALRLLHGILVSFQCLDILLLCCVATCKHLL